jgi:uncharacterized protein (TIGR02145 family)
MNETCAVCKKGIGPAKCEICGFSDDGSINRSFPVPEDLSNWLETVVKPYRIQWEAKKRENELLAQLEEAKKKENELLAQLKEVKANTAIKDNGKEHFILDRGYLTPHFVTNPDTMEVQLENPYILLYDKKISSIKDLLPTLKYIAKTGKSLLIVAEDVDGEALATLIVNKTRGTIRVAAVKAPGFGDRRKAMLEDIAILTGGQLVSEESGVKLEDVPPSVLGQARSVIIDKDTTTIVEGGGKSVDIKVRIAQIKKQMKETTSDYDREKMLERLALLGDVKPLSNEIKAEAAPSSGIFTDPRDGKVYRTVKIGNQIWMAENLNFDCLGSKCYGNDPKNAEKYGRLYDWETAKKACPPGWHLPNGEEWQTLVDFAGGETIAGKKLKAKNGWNNNGNGTDNYDFSALPGGSSNSDGSFSHVGYDGYWWSASGYSSSSAFSQYMNCDSEDAYWYSNGKSNLFSVRCIQDEVELLFGNTETEIKIQPRNFW